MAVELLTKEEVLRVHNRLVEDFAAADDPISPAGVRSEALLESAIGRQWVAIGDRLKYPSVHESAATLLYGICMDHPFHNGNKRTALVSMLAHLDKNKFSLFDVNQKELFDLMIGVASHTFAQAPRRSPRVKPDDEVDAVADWIKEHMNRVERGERPVTYRELRKILPRFGYLLDNPNDNSIDVLKVEQKTTGFFSTKITPVRKRIGNIPFPGDTRTVGLRHIKYVRNVCRLREEDGVDSAAFYDEVVMLDSFINRYRTVLRRLARR